MKAKISLFILFMISPFCLAYGGVHFEDNFDGYSDSPSNHGWSMGSQVQVISGSECYNGRCVKISYIDEGTGPYIFSRSVNYSEAYYKFFFKRKNHNVCGGCKFFKLRAIKGKNWDNYANITVQMDYGSGNLDQVDHGCGSELAGDQGCGGPFNAISNWGPGTVLTTNNPYIFPDENWHSFVAYVKLNSDGETDGAYTIWIDGVKYREVVNVKIRNDDNEKVFTHLLLGDYNRYDGCSPYQYELYYDDFVVSSEHEDLGIKPESPSLFLIE